MPLNEHVYCVAIAFKMTESRTTNLHKFCINLEYSSGETIHLIQKPTAMGNWWFTASTHKAPHSCITSRAEFLGETSNHPGNSASLQPRYGALQLLAFPKTKITFETEEILGHRWDSGKYEGQLMTTGRTVWGPKVPTLKGTEVSLPYVQYFSFFKILFILFLERGEGRGKERKRNAKWFPLTHP